MEQRVNIAEPVEWSLLAATQLRFCPMRAATGAM